FFCRSPLPRDLHSFPTRRSSDLGARLDELVPAQGAARRRGDAGNASADPDARPQGADMKRAPIIVLALLVGAAGLWWLFFRAPPDRKSTRLNSSHVKISYAVFCL